MAPSPTGNLHIGTARTTLFNWLFARKHGGEFILRIEDTDVERSHKHYEENIISGLAWLGLHWDGPIYRQTERLATYREHLEKLLASGKAFWCFHTKEELEQEGQEQQARKEAPRHICNHKGQGTRERGQGGIIRLAVDGNSTRKIIFHDIIRGDIEWQERLLGDISLAKDLDTPLYNFAVVIDDMTMQISHVIRGEDHISNTPKQILIYKALGVPLPQFAHLPLILAPDKSKISKRNAAISIDDLRKDYLPETLLNFMGTLGYSYSQEVMSLEEMAKEFELEKVHKSGAVFNSDKLNWLNAQYIRRLSPAQVREVTGVATLPDAAIPLVVQRLERLSDIQQFNFFWERPDYEPGLLVWKEASKESTAGTLEAVREIVQRHASQSLEPLRKSLDELSEQSGGRGNVYWPFRVALSGKQASPDPVEISEVIGMEETIARIEIAIQKLTS